MHIYSSPQVGTPWNWLLSADICVFDNIMQNEGYYMKNVEALDCYSKRRKYKHKIKVVKVMIRIL